MLKVFSGQIEHFLEGYPPNDENRALPPNAYSAPAASSYLQDSKGKAVHRPSNLLDDDPKTDWEECKGGKLINSGSSRSIGDTCPASEVDEAEGQGEWVEIPLTFEVRLKAMQIRSGFQAKPELFYRNPRPERVTIEVRDLAGTKKNSRTVRLLDETGYQNVTLTEEDHR